MPADRSSETTLNTALTPRPGTAGYIEPPDAGCIFCWEPLTSLVACHEYQIQDLAIIDADFTGLEPPATNFEIHSHDSDVGPPLLNDCFYTSQDGSTYAAQTGHPSVVVKVKHWIRTSWDLATTTGIITLHAVFFIDPGLGTWSHEYEAEISNDTYGSDELFTEAVNTLLAEPMTNTLDLGTSTGSISGVTVPSTISISHT